MNTKISLDDNIKTLIIDSMAEAIGTDISNYKKENLLVTYNGIHFTKWDFINTNIKNALPKSFQIYKIERGSLWSFLLIHDEYSGNLYIMMADKRFHELCKAKKLEKRQVAMKPHFLDDLVRVNKKHKVQQAQLSFFELELPEWEEICQLELEKMTNSLLGNINDLVVITHSASKGELKKVEAYIPTVNLEIFHLEDWSEFISPNFAAVLEILEDEYLLEEDDEVMVTLKKDSQSEDDIVKLRKDEKKKDKE